MSTTLPILVLSYPIVLLPSALISFHVSKNVGETLLSLLAKSNNLPIVAAVPLTVPPDSPSQVLSEWGTAARIIRITKPQFRSQREPYTVFLEGLTRVHLRSPLPSVQTELADHEVQYAPASEEAPNPETVAKFKDAAWRFLDRLAKDSTTPSKRAGYLKLAGMMDEVSEQRAPLLADLLMASVPGDHSDKLALLSTHSLTKRLNLAAVLLTKYMSISEVTKKISSAVDESLSRQQKEFYLRQQLAVIQRELHALSNNRSSSPTSSPISNSHSDNQASELDDDDSHEASDLADLKVKIEAMRPGSEERRMGVREWRRFKRIPSGSVESGVVRSYLEWLTSLPWPSVTTPPPTSTLDRTFLTNARSQLDADHFGLEKIKKRLIEYLAVLRLKEINLVQEEAKAVAKEDSAMKPTNESVAAKKAVKGPILLFVGPPGTGKTSLGQSIAKALGRPFQRISLGGVRDEAEIRGHRRTYVASSPGLIVQALRKAGTLNPVILLDEIDKVGHSNFHGDPAAALLEVLDPEQNHNFNDHYINVPIDLSQVLFVCTSNTLDTISAPLLDRCEVIQLSGYTYDEKMHIARRFLLPKQLQANGLTANHLSITEPTLLHITTHYTREAGVRGLERAIGSVVRYKAVEWAEHLDDMADDNRSTKERKEYKKVVEEHELENILGIARWDGEEREAEARRGVVYGLVVMGQGEGGILPVETIAVPGAGQLKLTGSLGDVIKESGEIALSWVKMHAYEMGITNSRAQDPLKVPNLIDVHLHLPAGAQKKDGPSAGIAMACAFASLLTGACVAPHIAMTGEITLRGRVTPVGGIKEKVLGAHRAQISKVILPWANRKDVDHDVPLEVRNDMEFVFVRTIKEALDAAFGKGVLAWRADAILLESRM